VSESWIALALLIPVAMLVALFAGRRYRRERSARMIEPRKRFRRTIGDERDRAPIDFFDRSSGTIAQLRDGTIQLRGTLVSASELLSASSPACVWRNRVDAQRHSAVAAELVTLADASGKVVLDGLEHAFVEAPVERSNGRHDACSLYLHDIVDVVGQFRAERFGESDDPTQLVYGTMVAPLRVRVVARNPAQVPATTKTDSE